VKLAELERYFAQVATSTSGPPDEVDEVFKSSAGLSASAQLGVYNRAYHYRLLDALASVFVRTQRALGEAQFERLGLRYLARHPSEHPAVERVGRAFPEYLRTQPQVAPALAELSALEWARLGALVAPNPSAIASASTVDLATFPASALCFVASLSTHSVSAPALALFAEQGDTSTSSEPCHVAVWRKRDLVQQERLDAVETAALERAMAGASVGQVCALFDSGAPLQDDAQRAFRVVSAWFAREWIERSVPHAPAAKPG